ncbi:GntR family transcriptional regulator [Wenjunlia vitaminophila]|uniref:GntR family transcriptional regulator n=1 Tax=Wenjunlia vitaminophila TaxID=76728 RepID=A0A0T6LQJ2_WENVI|nr:GntR family transcriptional regulator [Wenjunlia vitaminophila]KRV48111.1 GntR family transcriptional regulator [Wenjunlia vitaminophila]
MREQPPYLRIADLLRERIANHQWSPGDRLPSRAQLGREHGVGENVVRRAQELLISKGVLEGRAGSGTYVAEPRERLRVIRSRRQDQRGGPSFRAEMSALGKRGTWDSGTEPRVPAPADIAGRLGIAEGDLCVRTRYEFLADGRPVQLSTSWEPHALTAGTPVMLPESGPRAGTGVVARMTEIGIKVDHAVEQPEPGRATAEEAVLLGIQRGVLVTRIQRTYVADDGRAVETADIIVPARLGTIIYEVPVGP